MVYRNLKTLSALFLLYFFHPQLIFAEHTFAGIPISQEELLVLENIGYSVGYSEQRKNPLWVAYRLYECERSEKYERTKHFFVDFRTMARVEPQDYTHSGYSRGHMAPSLAIFLCYGKKAQEETYLMSNIVPQRQSHNAGIWSFVEKLNLKNHTKKFGTIYVVTGPIFSPEKNLTIGRGIWVPLAFYKITLARDKDKLKALALSIPHEEAKTKELRKYITTIREIEKLTGLDFFHELPDEEEIPLEETRAEDIWDLP
ncbi:MAG: DNA/RNA non-specific endonuclease [Leptospiraceae bacterium]|nr:DNA/RNA non-specific endonuclease [Leptospiraceae bacterium]MDW8307453.1 DNA/RNA non-specific endonuclease [Leptospiraceae bacterium]